MRNRFRLMSPEDAAGGAGGGATAAAPPPPPPAPSPAPAAAPAAKAASPAPGPAPAPAAAGGDAPGYWPADWREKIAGTDAEAAKALGRYATPADVAKALRAAQIKISSGELRAVLPKNPSAEQLAEWRQSNGIPESPEKYDLDLGGGLVVGEDDKPLVDDFLKVAHQNNLTPDQTKAVLRGYYSAQEAVSTARAEEDRRIQDESEETLRGEWGTEFRGNINRVVQLLDRVAPDGLAEQFLSGRLADGTPIGSSPAALKMLLGLSLIENPAGVLVPAGGSQSEGLDGEIAKIEKFMKTNRTAYNKDEKMQARYRDLLDAREKMKGRAAA